MFRASTLNATLLTAATLATLPGAASAQSGGGYDLSWSTIDCGGGTSSGGVYTLSGTIGQPDAGLTLSGGSFTLAGGFWTPAIQPNQCPCDWNHFDGLDSQDFFDFLNDFFVGNADFNGFDGTDSQDYFDFLECFFTGCP